MKKKLLIALTAITAAVCGAFGFAACGDNTGNGGNGGNGGNTEQGGSGNQGGKEEHEHELSLVPAKAATCTKDGNVAYYTCNGCDKWFKEIYAKTEITDKTSVVIAKGHKLTLAPANAATCTSDGNSAYYTCDGCDKWFADENGKTEIADKSSVVIAKGHKLTLTPASSATCTADGNTAYYTCAGCDKWFEDKDGNTEIADKSSVVIAKGHKLTLTLENEAKCTVDGNSAYYTCDVCDKWFTADEDKVEITDKTSVIQEKQGHRFTDSLCGVCGVPEPTAGLEYTLSSDGKYYACSGIGTATDKDIVIADIFDGKLVKSISKEAFYFCRSLKSITIPKGITSIGYDAFNYCTGLISVTIPDGVTSIDSRAFLGCSSLKEIILPDSVKSVGGGMFYGCVSLETVTLSEKIKELESSYYSSKDCGFFENCISLTEITIPESVVNIDRFAFSGCTSLEDITIPDSVTEVGGGVFYNCSGLKTVKLSNKMTSLPYYYLNRLSCGFFEGCKSLTSITIPEGMKSIGNNAFEGCNELSEIYFEGDLENWFNLSGISFLMHCGTLDRKLFIDGREVSGELTVPDGISKIEDYTFYNCGKLTGVIIPDSVTVFGYEAFRGCKSLKAIKYTGDIESWCGISGLSGLVLYGTVDRKLYINNREITGELIIPDGVTSISDSAFRGCSSLTGIAIGKDVTSIGESTFKGCSGLISITIPDGLASIGNSAFSGCGNLTSIAIPNSVTSIGENAFKDCNSLTTVKIGNGVTSINYGVFEGCSGLTSIKIPDSVKSIGNSVFKGCSNLKSITIPDGIASIGVQMFEDCISLTDITIPNSVTSIGDSAFRICSSLTDITFKGTKAQWDSIKKGSNWNDYTGNYTIHCIGEDIAK